MSDAVPPHRMSGPAGALVNRSEECAALDRLLDPVRGGLGDTLTLVGPPGIGKSTLLQYAVCSAGDDMSVCRVDGIESEMTLGFAGVHPLVLPLLGEVGQLPDRQRRGLEWALGLSAPDVTAGWCLAAQHGAAWWRRGTPVRRQAMPNPGRVGLVPRARVMISPSGHSRRVAGLSE
jgi:hypothetical protein